MEGQSSSWNQDFFLGGLLGLSILLLGFALGGGTPSFVALPGCLLLSASVGVAVSRGGLGAGPVWFFYPTIIGSGMVILRCFSAGGGSWAGWQDLLVGVGAMSYLAAAHMGGRGGFLCGAAVPAALLGLACALVVFLQAAGQVEGHPLWWMAPGQLPRGGEGGSYISGLLATRTSSAALLNATALMVVGYALWGKLGAGWRIVSIWSAGVMVVGGILCQSRAGIMGLAVGGACLAIASLVVAGRYKSRLVWGYLLALGGLGAGAALLLGFLFENHWGVRGRVLALLDDPYRISLWAETISRVGQNEFFWGIGPGKYHPWSKGFSGGNTGGDPVFLHNDWVQFALEYGWPAGMLFMGAFIAHVFGGIFLAGRRSESLGATWNWPQDAYLGGKVGGSAALASIGAHAFFDYPLHMPALACMAGFAAGVCAAGWERRGGKIEKAFAAGAGALLLYGVFMTFSEHAGGDFVSWRAEKMAADGNGEATLSLLRDSRGHSMVGGRQYYLTYGGIALQVAKTGRTAAARTRFAFEARESYSKVLEGSKGDVEGLRGLGISCIFLGNYGAAEANLRAAIEASPNSPRAYEWLGFCLEVQGRREEARKVYRISTRLGEAPLAKSGLGRLAKKAENAP